MLDHREEVIATWCNRESLRFISLTPALRTASTTGQQCYSTYDQHWSPVGHEVAAKSIHSVGPTGTVIPLN